MDQQKLRFAFKERLLQTMKAFDSFCQRYDLKYVAAYGTVIGAIRHKGLIPWDDDIDVFMDYDNYYRFLKLKSEAKTIGYDIVDRKDYGYYLPVAKFVDMGSTILERKEYSCVFGVFIDVFPLGYVENVEESRKMHAAYLYHSKKMALGLIRHNFSFALLKEIIVNPFYYFQQIKERFNISYHQSELDKLDLCISKIKQGKYRLYYRSMDSFDKSLFRSEWFDTEIRVPFEDFEISIPAKYEEYLKTVYGDYMTPPPVEKQVSNHGHYYLNLQEGLSIKEVKDRIKKGEYLVY